VELRVDGFAVSVSECATVLEACDRAGRYVPRLCSYPGLGSPWGCERATEAGADAEPDEMAAACGLCAVRIDGGKGEATVLACCTAAEPGMEVVTDDPALRGERLERLAELLVRHPHICLSCPDRDGCTREECTFGIAAEARCCGEFGRCELGKLVAYLDAGESVPRRAIAVCRDASAEGRIRREPGLCLGCGRCVAVCTASPAAGKALRLVRVGKTASLEPGGDPPPAPRSGQLRAVPKKDTLRASGCTFCGQCVMVCPSGASTAPGEAGSRWLEGWRQRTGLSAPVLPPDLWRPLAEDELAAVPPVSGVFLLADDGGRVLRIAGVADLSRGVPLALAEPVCAAAASFRIEPAPLFTQRESELLARFAQQHGQLPPGDDLGDDLFGDGLFSDDFE